jgi:hypothetical protein
MDISMQGKCIKKISRWIFICKVQAARKIKRSICKVKAARKVQMGILLK